MLETKSDNYDTELIDKLAHDRNLSDEEFSYVLLHDDPQFSEYLSAKARTVREISSL